MLVTLNELIHKQLRLNGFKIIAIDSGMKTYKLYNSYFVYVVSDQHTLLKFIMSNDQYEHWKECFTDF